MKSWFTLLAEYKRSNALDETSRAPGSSGGERQDTSFSASLALLHEQLKAQPTKPEVPAQLHRTIMTAVQASARRHAAVRWWPRWALAGGCLAIFMAIFGLSFLPRSVNDSTIPLNAAATALELGNEIPPAVTSGAVAPLSIELQRVGQDLTNLTQFVLASLP